LGIALYRAGNFTEALSTLQKSAELRQGGDAADWFFLAMACHKLNQPEQAEQWLKRASEWTAANKASDPEFNGFRKEAEALLHSSSAAPMTSSENKTPTSQST
jgi:Flp pilus assembly protein TadD